MEKINDFKDELLSSITRISGLMNFGITWDRVTEDDKTITVFGWIRRAGKDRDFVLIDLDKKSRSPTITTSSAKLSTMIDGEMDENNPCIKFSEYFKDQEIDEKIRLEDDK